MLGVVCRWAIKQGDTVVADGISLHRSRYGADNYVREQKRLQNFVTEDKRDTTVSFPIGELFEVEFTVEKFMLIPLSGMRIPEELVTEWLDGKCEKPIPRSLFVWGW
jgi:hypothetical protein